jgi:hypothetical protein
VYLVRSVLTSSEKFAYYERCFRAIDTVSSVAVDGSTS